MICILKLIAVLHPKNVVCRDTSNIQSEEISNGPFEISKQALFKYETGDISGAQKIFSENWSKFSSIELFQTSYLSFLLKTGQYQKMFELKNIQGEKNIEMLQQAKECLRKLLSNDPKQILSLIEISPDSLEANSAVIKQLIKSGDVRKAQQYLVQLEKVYPRNNEVLNLRIMVDISLENIGSAMDALKRADFNLHTTFKTLYTTVQSILSISDIDMKLNRLLGMYRELYGLQFSSPDTFGLFSYLYRFTLRKIVEIGCDSLKPVESFARLLLKLEKNEFSIFYYIKSLIIDRKLKTALDELANYDKELGHNAKNSLKQFVQQMQSKIDEEEKAREEERRRQKEWEQRERQRSYERQATSKAGQDFLGYYKALGVDKAVTADNLKKVHRKKIREATKKAAKNTSITQEQKDGEAKLINKAFQILSDPEKKKMYDLGIDPEKGPQYGDRQHQGYGYGSGGPFFDEDQINEIFQSFFGGGGGRRGGGRYQRRTQYIFL
ncbi:uncharacterized protein VICG_00295 [Vittaforma corneae ATCC 50505]|uniref:J domain-containing protein n=1 Tax=Vittaforma corneae (strain ATCC 50505) TaxID=993615 RepID=L2GNT0_VITCO|nr:uncharacterized protein VICG_00295 [Vittaforma corneae ATCC 50505]ELA42543.1 hypothetical protein VICG_00295 [Vittaforma corneae ATCC 50505]